MKYDIYYYEKYDDIDRIRKRISKSRQNMSYPEFKLVLAEYKSSAVQDPNFYCIEYRKRSESILIQRKDL